MLKNKIAIPKDLGIKIGTEEEVFWTKIKTDAEQTLKNLKNQIIFTEALLEMVKIKIEEEKIENRNN